jgi:hypothetical protein
VRLTIPRRENQNRKIPITGFLIRSIIKEKENENERKNEALVGPRAGHGDAGIAGFLRRRKQL